MSFGTILYTILISPLQMFFEFIFSFAQRFINDPGISIIVLSLVMNFLVLPLYKRADAMQAEERDTEARLHDGITHIKKVFSGDERMMIQQEYYRQNNYKTFDALKGSVSLFLEIPFFIGAYQFLSHLKALQGVSFGPLANLGAQDGLLVIGGLSVNLLPIAMTTVNLISCIIYTKGFPRKTKIQLYAMAVFFLFFLYSSPSGLVFYWTLNNVFSLCKNIFYKIKNPRKVLAVLSSAGGAVPIGSAFLLPGYTWKEMAVLCGIGIALQLPLVLYIIKKKHKVKEESGVPNKKMFLLAGIFLTVILGLLIPSSVIKSSPQEFVDVLNYHNPLWYVISAGCLAFGTFLIWFGVFYWLADRRGKILFEKVMWIACGISILDYMLFGTGLGILSSSLQYEKDFHFTEIQMLINGAALLAAALVMLFVFIRFKKITASVLTVGILAMGCMAAYNAVKITDSVSPLKQQAVEESENMPQLTLSQNGKNVVVIMLDRALGPMIPYIFNEKPELKKEFDGFTDYQNTVSFGGFTNFGSPALYGGYEYTPVEINKRNQESLMSKQNEAIRVMPVLFDQNGYEVTVCDPTYANYNWSSDTSIYQDYPDIHTYVTNGRFTNTEAAANLFLNNKRNFFCYSLMKSSPLLLQHFLYNGGKYMKPEGKDVNSSAQQTIESNSTAEGVNGGFMNSYTVLTHLSNITTTNNQSKGAFIMMSNDTTHEAALLQEPEYEPAEKVDNTVFDQENAGRFNLNGRIMKMDNDLQYSHYDSNMAAMIQLGKWFDDLRANHVYDNTRIILVSDHGRPIGQFDGLLDKNDSTQFADKEWFAPLLMVKDFNSTGFTISDEFMTNGDVPTIATADVIQDPRNPATGKPINEDAKYAGVQYVLASEDFDISKNNGNVFLPGDWYSVHDNIWDKADWKSVVRGAILPN